MPPQVKRAIHIEHKFKARVDLSEDEVEPGPYSDLDLDLSSDHLGSDTMQSSAGLDLPIWPDSSDLVGSILIVEQ